MPMLVLRSPIAMLVFELRSKIRLLDGMGFHGTDAMGRMRWGRKDDRLCVGLDRTIDCMDDMPR